MYESIENIDSRVSKLSDKCIRQMAPLLFITNDGHYERWRTIAQSEEERMMEYLHTMVRVSNLEQSLQFYCELLGLTEVSRQDNEKARYTLVFLAAPGNAQTVLDNKAPLLELTYNWDEKDYGGGRNFGHLAYRVDDIYALCQRLMDGGVIINRPPRDGHMAFVRSPDNISIELLQKDGSLPPQEPWLSMPNSGAW